MKVRSAATALLVALSGALGPLVGPADAAASGPQVRVATFNASLNRNAAGDLVRDLSNPRAAQPRAIAETIQRTRPDVVLINEFDFTEGGAAVDLFRRYFLQVPQHGARPITYPYAYVAPVNTGVPSGHDLNNDGRVGGPDDAYGFGLFPGQYGMVVLSRYPIQTRDVRSFQTFLWKDMPGALLPDDPATPAASDWYSADELRDVRLSSKSHWDVPVRVGGRTVHVLASHPTPPSFDGPEKRNQRRNHDEIRLWADYVKAGAGDYLYDDQGRRGGLAAGSSFVIMGDQNADPFDGDSVDSAITQLLDHPAVVDPMARSAGAAEASARQGGANLTHRGDPALDTADFNDNPAPGNLRVDYVLPSRAGLEVAGAGVYWLTASDPLFGRLVGDYPFPTSDHRLVWTDVTPR